MKMEHGYFAMKAAASLAESRVRDTIKRYDFLKKMPSNKDAINLYNNLQKYYENNTSFRSNFCSVWEKIHESLDIDLNVSDQVQKERAAILTVIYANTPYCRKKAKSGLLKVMRKTGGAAKAYEDWFYQLVTEYSEETGSKIKKSSIKPVKFDTVENPNALLPPEENDKHSIN